MSQRKTTAPPTPKHSRSSLSSRKGLIATEKTKKQSAKKRTALDNRFHRTIWRRSAALCLLWARNPGPYGSGLTIGRRSAALVHLPSRKYPASEDGPSPAWCLDTL